MLIFYQSSVSLTFVELQKEAIRTELVFREVFIRHSDSINSVQKQMCVVLRV